MAEVQSTAQNNVLANEQQHCVQSKPIYDTHLLKKVDRNTTPYSTNMRHRGGEIDQNAKKCQVSCPVLDPSFDNMTTKFSNQSLEFENISLKKTIARLQKDFSRMEAHCINMELKYQNQALKDEQHDQILNETSNKAMINKEMEKCVFNANHDACKTKFLKEVISRVKVQSPKTRNSNKPVEPKIHTQKPGRQIVTGHRFSPNKSSDVHEKTNTPRSCLMWIPTGRIFNNVDLMWVPTGKIFTYSTTKVDCEPPNGSNEDITNPYKCDQTLNVRAVPVAVAPRAVDLVDSLVSTLIDQDAPSTSIPSTQYQEHSLIIFQGFEESPKTPHFHDDPLFESLYEDSPSQGSSSNVRPIHTPFK
nr:hypothetical protein [Tanacetum cinerariifolium]